MIGFLHDLGTILHYQDDPHLETLGILKPRWVTNGVYKILNSLSVFHNKGVLTLEMINTILDEPEYPSDKRIFIIDMMRKFELCYDIKPNDTFLIPDLLPKDEPYTGDWSDSMVFQYQYNVLPFSIISRFIVRMNAFIYGTVWRSGVVLKHSNNIALVKADYEERKINIWISGDSGARRDFIAIIAAQFSAIHKEFAQIQIKELISPSEYANTLFDYRDLLQLERDGITESNIVINGKTIKFNVTKILDTLTTEASRRGNFPRKSTRSRSLIRRIIEFVFSSLPRVIGRFIFDLFNRPNVAVNSELIMGYVIITISLLLTSKIINLELLISIWRFFFPEGN